MLGLLATLSAEIEHHRDRPDRTDQKTDDGNQIDDTVFHASKRTRVALPGKDKARRTYVSAFLGLARVFSRTG